MKRVAHADREWVAAELRRLPDLDRAALAERWVSFFGQAPPLRTSRSLLIRVRGMISGALKKKLGLDVASSKEKRGRIYRIVTVVKRAA